MKLSIYDLKGEKIKTILNEKQSSGEYALRWNGLNDNGKRIASGVYFYQIEVNDDKHASKLTRKMLMLK